MKYCYECGYTTAGEPLFCNSCGRSYDSKLCPKLHMNPRLAEACSHCGSRDLSTPQPRVPAAWLLLALLVQLTSAVLLAALSLTAILGIFKELHVGATIDNGHIALALFLTTLWCAWTAVPNMWRRIIRRSLGRSKHERKFR